MLIKRTAPGLLYVLFFTTVSQCDETPNSKGSCPPTVPVELCSATCGPEQPCVNVTQMCCPTACGGSMCVDPMTKRHFVDQEKPGRCPEYPGGAWVCTNMCTSDFDCPRALKCCANRCGAHTCQRPEDVPTTTAPDV